MGVIHVEKCISPVFRLYCNVLSFKCLLTRYEKCFLYLCIFPQQ